MGACRAILQENVAGFTFAYQANPGAILVQTPMLYGTHAWLRELQDLPLSGNRIPRDYGVALQLANYQYEIAVAHIRVLPESDLDEAKHLAKYLALSDDEDNKKIAAMLKKGIQEVTKTGHLSNRDMLED